MRPTMIGLITLLLMTMSFSAAAISVWSDSTNGSSCDRQGDEQEAVVESVDASFYGFAPAGTPYFFELQQPFSYFEYRRTYPLFRYHYRPFPYQCGPFPENLPYGLGYDERCTYPYFRQRPTPEVEAVTPRPPVRLSDDVTARWLTPDVLALVWHGNPNGVTQVEFSLLDYGRVVMHRVRIERPPYTTAMYVPYGAVMTRTRTYGLLQSVLQETIVPLPSR